MNRIASASIGRAQPPVAVRTGRPATDPLRVGRSVLNSERHVGFVFRCVCAYRGRCSLGHVHRKWNLALTMFACEAESISDGTWIHRNKNFPQLCAPVGEVQHFGLWMFFGRLRDNPEVTANVRGLCEYVEYIHPPPSNLDRVSIFADRRTSAPWRTFVPKRKSRSASDKINEGGLSDCPGLDRYRTLIHEAGSERPHDLLLAVDAAVPKSIPDFLRVDICQDLIVSLLSGDITKDDLAGPVRAYTSKVFRMHPPKYAHLSMDAPIGESGTTLGEMLEADRFRF